MYCIHCGRKINHHCVCITSHHFRRLEIGLLVLLVMFLPLHAAMYTILHHGFAIYDMSKIFIANVSLSVILLLLTIASRLFKKPYLAIFMGCHQKKERSFQIYNYSMMICVRCFGIIIGCFIFLLFSKEPASLWVYFVLAIPSVIDGFLQYKKIWISSSLRRFVTGVLLAPSIITLLALYNHLILLIARNFLPF